MEGGVGHQSRRGGEPRLALLLADDDATLRSELAALARERVEGFVVLEASDGMEAILIGRRYLPQIALLDAATTGVGGIEAALALRALRPQVRVALQALDPLAHRARAREHRLPLFDKGRVDDAIAWLELQARTWLQLRSRRDVDTKLDLECRACGYGVARHAPPPRCPMCQREVEWLRRSRRPLSRHSADLPQLR
jgi:DNA-binding NarL/FixJ family response regulator